MARVRFVDRRRWHVILMLLVGIAGVHAGGLYVADRMWPHRILNLSRLALFRVVPPMPPPEDVEMAFVELPAPSAEQPLTPAEEQLARELAEVNLPRPPEPPKPEPPQPRAPPPPPEKKAEPPKPKAPEIALAPAPKPPTPPPPQPPPPPEEKKQVQAVKPPPMERKKMVEIQDDKDVLDQPPPEANYYSDKNRRPAEETYAKDRNLERTQQGDKAPSAKSDDKASEEVGGPEEQVRQQENTEAATLDAKRQEETAHDGRHDKAQAIKTGQGGQTGQEGQAGQRGQQGDGGTSGQNGAAGKLAIRDAKGLGAAQGMGVKPSLGGSPDDDSPEVAETQRPGGSAGSPGRSGAAGRPGAPGQKGPKLTLDQKDYQRIVGQDKADEEVALAQRKASAKKGKWDKKLARVRSTLETFSGEVKPGNQTALGTRAHPFAVYIARMHNRIHELWGFGFLADLDGKPQSNPMNDRKLEVTLEIVITPEGEVEKVTIVKPSGISTFDISAVDVVESAGPYSATPQDIRSGDGKVYMHWTFHRDERQCTPYFADPFILDNGGPAREAAVGEHGEHGHGANQPPPRKPPQVINRQEGSPTDGAVQVPRVTREQVPSGQAVQGKPNADDPRATETALAWGDAFEKGDIATLVARSTTPFSSRGKVVAQDAGSLAAVWRAVMSESGNRKISQWQVMSAAGYRLAFGHLPQGADGSVNDLYLAVKVGKDTLTITLTRQGDGSYLATAVSR
jgi:TonB family protein